jgi:cysteine desulfurase
MLAMAASGQSVWRHRAESNARVAAIKQTLSGLTAELEDTFINGSVVNSSPYILNLSFLDVKAEVLVHMLDEKGIYISTGSACNTRHPGHSSLNALRLAADRLNSAVRFSFSELNTLEEAEECKAAVIEAVRSLRQNLRHGWH